jgi:hypothetical protein
VAFNNMAKVIAEALKKVRPQQEQPSAPRDGKGFSAAIINALQQMPQAAGTPRRRGIAGAVQQAALAAAPTLRPTAMKKGGAVKKAVAKKAVAKKPVMKTKARKK